MEPEVSQNENRRLNAGLLTIGLVTAVLLFGLFSRLGSPKPETQRVYNPTGLLGNIIQVDVRNGVGESGLAARMTSFLREAGFDVIENGDHNSFDVDSTVVLDRIGNLDAAYQVALALGIPREKVTSAVRPDLYLDVSVVIGSDYKTVRPFAARWDRSERLFEEINQTNWRGNTLGKADKIEVEKTMIPDRPPGKERVTSVPVKTISRFAIDAILEKKGKDILVIDVHDVSGIADIFIVATGDSDLQIRAIVESVRANLRENAGERVWHVEGNDHHQWVLLDYVDLVVHVFQKETRAFYSLERLWGDAPQEEVDELKDATSVKLLKDWYEQGTRSFDFDGCIGCLRLYVVW
jgi:ribosome-associated protein